MPLCKDSAKMRSRNALAFLTGVFSLFYINHNNAYAYEIKKGALKYEFSIPSEKDENRGVYFKNIHSMNCDKEGNIYILDWKISVISKFDSLGNYICNIGRSGQGPGEYLSPQHICFDSDGNIILYDYGNGRIQSIDLSGKYLSSFKTFKYIHKMIYSNGYLFTINTSADSRPDLIDVIDLKGNKFLTFGREERLDVPRFRSVNFKHIYSDDNGNIYLGWDYFPWIHMYTNDGKLIQKIELTGLHYQDRGGVNLKTVSSNNPNPLFFQIVSGVAVDNDEIYILTIHKGIIINIFMKDGSMKSTYMADLPSEKTFIESMEFRKVMGKKYFYLVSNSPECRVFVYSIN